MPAQKDVQLAYWSEVSFAGQKHMRRQIENVHEHLTVDAVLHPGIGRGGEVQRDLPSRRVLAGRLLDDFVELAVFMHGVERHLVRAICRRVLANRILRRAEGRVHLVEVDDFRAV